MNNKGFAITTVLYGLLVTFLIIVIGTLSILSNQKRLMEELIDGDNGARSIVKLKEIELSYEDLSNGYMPRERALYIYRYTQSGVNRICKKYYNKFESTDEPIYPSNMMDGACIE